MICVCVISWLTSAFLFAEEVPWCRRSPAPCTLPSWSADIDASLLVDPNKDVLLRKRGKAWVFDVDCVRPWIQVERKIIAMGVCGDDSARSGWLDW